MKLFWIQLAAKVLYPLIRPYLRHLINDPKAGWDEKTMAALDALFGGENAKR